MAKTENPGNKPPIGRIDTSDHVATRIGAFLAAYRDSGGIKILTARDHEKKPAIVIQCGEASSGPNTFEPASHHPFDATEALGLARIMREIATLDPEHRPQHILIAELLEKAVDISTKEPVPADWDERVRDSVGSLN